MATTTIYHLPGYPTVHLTIDGTQIDIRPMVPEDRDALLEFFRGIPEEDRFYLKEDVTDANVIARWAENLDYGRALPLLAIKDGRIVADATLHQNRAGARRHVGDVRIVVAPDYRGKGIGRGLIHKLAEIARDKGITKLMFELVTEKEEAAKRTAIIQGFTPVAVLKDHVRDIDGRTHDVMLMELRVKDAVPDETEVF